jgi:hypothetical protein
MQDERYDRSENRGDEMTHYTPGKVYIKKTEKPLTFATVLAMVIVGIPAGIFLGWFLYGFIGLGR